MHRRRWGRAGAALALLCLAQLMTAPSASAGATAGCWRATCTGEDPYAMGCAADAEVLHQINVGTDIEVKLVWSPLCQATWAKVTIDPAYPEQVYGTLWHTPTLGGVEHAYGTSVLSAGSPSGTSLMGNWKATNKACWNIQSDSWDPEPLVYESDGHVVSPPLVNGSCTDWI
ncbi:YjfA family protein [Streptomyces sp. NBC_01077]|uniref:DUF2690 domain-containing protein n=1 Tax=Streptomyces sp. NBC_01077 TaxID=2903746 RepID=UPI0038678B7E|nr:YjfA family protein [Streptomyces sp. NBC_01077]